jgi:hypothetical protein
MTGHFMDRTNIERISKALANETRLLIMVLNPLCEANP